MTLSRVDSGEVTLKAIHGGRGLKSKLYSLGLTPGARFSVLRQDPCGRTMIRVKGCVFALGNGMTEKITVELGRGESDFMQEEGKKEDGETKSWSH